MTVHETTPAPQAQSHRFQSLVTLSMALITVWAAIVAALQTGASNRQNEANERNQSRAVSAVGELLSAGQKTAHQVELYTRWYELSEQARQARAAAQAARLGGNEALALEHEKAAERWNQAAEALREETELLTDSHYDYNDQVYREEASRTAYLELERQQAAGRESQDWGGKADTYVSVLTTLAVVLFLFGLSLTIESRLRFMFVGVGWMMAVVTVLWTLVVAILPVHVTSEEAMAHYVEGKILVNSGYYFYGAEQSDWYDRARGELTRAIELDDRYAAAYEQRALTQLDARLRDGLYANAAAEADFQRAIELGSDNPIVNTNLGWAAFLAGNYENSIRASERAIELDSKQCVAHLNLGLAKLASGLPSEANTAYDRGIDCAMNGPVRSRPRLFDAAIADLSDLQYVYPNTPGVDDALVRFKELSVAYELFGGIGLRATAGKVGEVRFAEDVGVDRVPLSVGASFAPGTPKILTFFTYEGVTPNTAWLVRWYRDGQLYDSFSSPDWAYEDSGETWVSVYGSPMPAGRYDVEIYFNGHLARTASFEVEQGEAVAMDTYTSSVYQLSINHPLDWTVSETTGEDGSLIFSRDDLTYLYYFTLPDYDGNSDDLLSGMQAVWQNAYPDVQFDEPGTFYMAGLPGAVYVYAWHTDADGNPLVSYLMGVIDDTGLARVIWAQMPEEDSEATYRNYFFPMIKSLQFGDMGMP